MASYLDKQGLQTFLDCLREEELSPIQNDVSSLQQTKADNETVVNGLASVENKVDEGVSALSTKIDNIDLSSVAKQGENQEATNTAILDGINRMLSRSVVYNSSTGDLIFENVDIIIE